MKIFRHGLLTWIIIQLALGPVFFFIMNIVLQKWLLDGFAGVLAVTSVDYFYITLSIFGIGRLLGHKKVKNIFALVSPIVLIIFGTFMIWKILATHALTATVSSESDFLGSFVSVFLLTISSPVTIVFFTSIFSTKAVEHNYTKKNLIVFGLGTWLATFLFMWAMILTVSLFHGIIPSIVVNILNILVGWLLIVYGGVRFYKTLRKKK